MPPATFTGWRYAALIGTLVGGVALACYPVIIQPYLNPEPWKQKQREIRGRDDREKMQPGGMKVWSDPFQSKKD